MLGLLAPSLGFRVQGPGFKTPNLSEGMDAVR